MILRRVSNFLKDLLDSAINQPTDGDVLIYQDDKWINDDTLKVHIEDKINPHDVTAAQAGTYTATEIDNKDDAIEALIPDISGKADKSYVDTQDELKANVSHTQAISTITNLQTVLDATATYQQLASAIAEEQTKRWADDHAHSDLTTTAHGGIVADTDYRLSDARNPLSHIQSISTITNLQTTLDGKANLSGGNTFNGNQTLSNHLLMSSTMKIYDTANPSKFFQMDNAAGQAVLQQYFGYLFTGYNGAAYTNILNLNGLSNNSSGTNKPIQLTPLIRQTGTAGYTAIELNVTETSLGSGTKILQDWKVGGNSRAYLDNNGTMYLSGNLGVGIYPTTKFHVDTTRTTEGAGSQPMSKYLFTVNNATNATSSYAPETMLVRLEYTGSAGISNNISGAEFQVSQTGTGTIAYARAFTAQIQHGSAGVITSAAGADINGPYIYSTGTIGSLKGLNISNQGHAKVTNAYGLYIADQTGATTANYSIYSGGGKMYHAGVAGFGGVPSSAYPLTVYNPTAGYVYAVCDGGTGSGAGIKMYSNAGSSTSTIGFDYYGNSFGTGSHGMNFVSGRSTFENFWFRKADNSLLFSIDKEGKVKPSGGYQSTDGTEGITATCTVKVSGVDKTATFKNGLLVSIA